MDHRTYRYWIAAVIILFGFAKVGYAGELPGERLVVQVSQHYLLAGEKLMFSVMQYNDQVLDGGQISNLAFAELVDKSNHALVRSKILLKDNSGSGIIAIPDTLSSGRYFLVVYTNWMKNFGQQDFSFTEILVVKPGDDIGMKDSISGFTAHHQMRDDDDAQHINIIPEQPAYKSREKVVVNLIPKTNSGRCIISVSVRKKEPFYRKYLSDSERFSDDKSAGRIQYLPDYKGIILEGIIKNSLNNNPMPDQNIYLTFPGENVEIKQAISGPDGRFSFLLLPESGEKDMVFYMDSEDAGVWLTERFTNEPFILPVTEAFTLNEQQIDFFTKKYIKIQLENKFHQKDMLSESTDDKNNYFRFYGNPYQTLFIKDYVRLDSLHEYFYELIPTVHLNRKKDRMIMYLTDPSTNLSLDDAPALFVDGVYYPYPDQLMKMDVGQVNRIEVIPKTYYYRNMTFGGIVSVFTTSNNLMNLPLMPEMTRIFYNMADHSNEYVPVTYNKEETKVESHLPDLRWLLHWQTNLVVEDRQTEAVEFFTSDEPGEFEIEIKGLSEKGEIIYNTAGFIVE